MIKCDCCGRNFKTLNRDYRYIDGLFQGKCAMCNECVGLSDVEVYKEYIRCNK